MKRVRGTMKVCMLNPPFLPHFIRSARWQEVGRGGSLYYPIWLAYATGILEKEGHQVKLIDAPAKEWDIETTQKNVEQMSPDLIVLDTSFPSLKNDIKVAEVLKKTTTATIVVTGPPASVFEEEILRTDGVDIVARGEYDLTIKDVANALDAESDLRGIKGISYKQKGKIIKNENRSLMTPKELDEEPFVSSVYKKHLDVKQYFLSSSLYPEVQIFTGRGCPFHCTFCLWPQTFTGRTYRTRSVRNIVEEFKYVEQNLPEVKEIVIEDDTFTINAKHVQKFCTEIIKESITIPWNCQVRATLDCETLRLMKKAGCRLVIVGFESSDEKILKNIKKGISLQNIEDFSKNANRVGLLVHADFIIGLPGETRETIAETKSLIKLLKPSILQVSVATPFPGTEFYDWAKNNGYLVTNDLNEYLDEYGRQKSVVSYPWLSAEEITNAVDDILRDYYLSISYVPVALKQVFRRNGFSEFKRLLYSVRAFTKRGSHKSTSCDA